MLVRSNILRSPHAFSTRCGGISELSHTRSLNLAFGRGDDDSTVLKNLDIFSGSVGFDPRDIVSLPQIHSDIIYTVTEDDRGKGYFIRNGIKSGDGYITNRRGVVLGIKTADCTPVLLEAESNGQIIAVGAVHAGWRGTVADIVGKCIERLCDEFGADTDNIRASIGPCIHSCCYEVGHDVYEKAVNDLDEDIAIKFVKRPKIEEEKYMCDLPAINRALLLRRGIRDENIEIINECTCCNPEKFFSHRYSNGHRGTMLNVIFMR